MGSYSVIDEFNKLCKQSNVVYSQIKKTKRARNNETVAMYNKLYKLPSDQLYDLNAVINIFGCDVLSFDDISWDKDSAYICHTNLIEHEVYKRFDLPNNRDNYLIPKNHISRDRNVDMNKYPICDQMTATAKKLDSYLQCLNVGSPTRYQGREIEVGKNCYYLVEENSLFTGREIYTVGTRCQDIKSIHIVIVKVAVYKDPEDIIGTKVVDAKYLDIPEHDKTFHFVTIADIAKVIKQYGDPGTYYRSDIVTSGDYVIYSTIQPADLRLFCDVHEDEHDYTVVFKKHGKGRKTLSSIAKRDPSMHFDYMPKVYDIVKTEIRPPRIKSTGQSRKKYDKLVDMFAAFPTVLHKAPMPKAGMIYEEYDPSLLNFYKYKGDIVSKGSLITEELAKKLGDSEYVFSTEKQIGCEIGHYTYEQAWKSKEAKKQINKDFAWGLLESDFYKREFTVIDGDPQITYVKHNNHTLELVGCAVWSCLCCVMLDAVSSINAKDFVVVTDGLYFNGDQYPKMPEWCDYRVINEKAAREHEKDNGEKYTDVEFQTYKDLPTANDLRRAKDKERKAKQRAEMTEEERAAKRAKDAERKRLARAKNK